MAQPDEDNKAPPVNLNYQPTEPAPDANRRQAARAYSVLAILFGILPAWGGLNNIWQALIVRRNGYRDDQLATGLPLLGIGLVCIVMGIRWARYSFNRRR